MPNPEIAVFLMLPFIVDAPVSFSAVSAHTQKLWMSCGAELHHALAFEFPKTGSADQGRADPRFLFF
jgi:hypothetical protein